MIQNRRYFQDNTIDSPATITVAKASSELGGVLLLMYDGHNHTMPVISLDQARRLRSALDSAIEVLTPDHVSSEDGGLRD